MPDYSTNDVKNLRFQPHGLITITKSEAGILVYKAIGPANLELLQAFVEIDKQVLKDYTAEHKLWCEVIVFERSCMILPDALEMLKEHLHKTQEAGENAYATAFVWSSDVEGADIMADSYRELYSEAGFKIDIFDNEASAFDWAHQQRQIGLSERE